MNLRAVQESLVEASTIPVQIHVTQYSSQVERVKHHHYPTDTEIKDKKILKHFAREGLNVNSAITQQPRGEGSRLPTETVCQEESNWHSSGMQNEHKALG